MVVSKEYNAIDCHPHSSESLFHQISYVQLLAFLTTLIMKLTHLLNQLQECINLPIAETKHTNYDHAICALNKTILYLLPGSFIIYSILLVLDNRERA